MESFSKKNGWGNLKYNHKISLLVVAFACFLFVSTVQAVVYYRNTNYYLCIPNSNVFLNFDEFRVFDDFFPDNGTGTLFFDLPDTYTIYSLMFSGTDCNVTINDLGENGKLYVADVVGSDVFVNFTLGYSSAYLQTVDGEIINVDVDEFGVDVLTWNVTGTGVCVMTVPFPVDKEPSYLKIGGETKTKGVDWSVNENVVTVTDSLGSTHDYELGFVDVDAPPPYSPSSGDDTDDIIPEDLVDVIDMETDSMLIFYVVAVLSVTVIATVAVYYLFFRD